MNLLSRILLCNAACSILAIPPDDDGSNTTEIFGDPGEPIMPELHGILSLKTINVERKYVRWPRRSHIPYALHKSYSPLEAALIRSAIAQIMADLSFWISFVNVPVNSSEYKILITPLKVDNVTPENICYSFPGMLTIASKLASKGIKEQRLVIARGPTGCLDGTIHSVLRYLAVVLGKRNEHERGDRGKFIQLLPENLASAGHDAYRLYSATEAIWSLFPYDYCSITHASQTEFALPGKVAFMVLQEPFFIPKLNRLSETDCRLLLLLYGGDPSACSPLVCSSLTGVRLTTNSPTSSTTMSTSTMSTSTTTLGTTSSSTAKPVIPTFVSSKIETTRNGITTVCYSFPSQSNTTSTISPSTTMAPPIPQILSRATTLETSTISSTTTTSTSTEPTSTTLISPSTEMILMERGEIGVACPDSFCSTKIDHASLYWDGSTSLLFSGNCTQKISNSFQLIGSPTSIADALPGSLIYGTVQAAWTNLELGQYRLHVVDRNGIQRGCSETACVREDPRPWTGSLFSVQSGQSQIFRMFSLDGNSNIIDMTREQIPITISLANGAQSASVFARIDTAWMFYNTKGENTVAVIGSDHTGKQYIGEVEADLTKSPATFTFKNSPPVMPLTSKLLPCA